MPESNSDLYLEFTGNFVYDAALVGKEIFRNIVKNKGFDVSNDEDLKLVAFYSLINPKCKAYIRTNGMKGIKAILKICKEMEISQLNKINGFVDVLFLFYKFNLKGKEKKIIRKHLSKSEYDLLSARKTKKETIKRLQDKYSPILLDKIRGLIKDKKNMEDKKNMGEYRYDRKLVCQIKLEEKGDGIDVTFDFLPSDVGIERTTWFGKLERKLKNLESIFMPRPVENIDVPAIALHGANASIITEKSNDSISIEFKETKKDETKKDDELKVSGMTISSSYAELFVSPNKQPFSFFAKDVSEKRFQDFENSLWIFYHYLFTKTDIGNIFIYHPNPKVMYFVNFQLKKLSEIEKTSDDSIFKKALLYTILKYPTLAAMDTFMIIRRGGIDKYKQKTDFFQTFSIKKYVAGYFLNNYSKDLAEAKCYTAYSKEKKKEDYLLFALNYTTPIEISINYLRYISDQMKNKKKKKQLYGKNIFKILPDFQAYLEELGKASKSNPYKSFNYIIDLDYDRIYVKDLYYLSEAFNKSQADKRALASHLISIAKGNKRDDFISLATKLAFQQRQSEALSSIEKISRYKHVWIPTSVYIIFDILDAMGVKK